MFSLLALATLAADPWPPPRISWLPVAHRRWVEVDAADHPYVDGFTMMVDVQTGAAYVQTVFHFRGDPDEQNRLTMTVTLLDAGGATIGSVIRSGVKDGRVVAAAAPPRNLGGGVKVSMRPLNADTIRIPLPKGVRPVTAEVTFGRAP